MFTKQFLVIASIIVSLLMVVIVNLVRLRNTKKPAVAKKIILPPLFMATGASMFILPMFRPTLPELISSVVMGMLFSIVLIKTSKFEIRDKQIYLQRSKLFLVALIGLVTLRMIGKIILAETIHMDGKIIFFATAGLFVFLKRTKLTTTTMNTDTTTDAMTKPIKATKNSFDLWR